MGEGTAAGMGEGTAAGMGEGTAAGGDNCAVVVAAAAASCSLRFSSISARTFSRLVLVNCTSF